MLQAYIKAAMRLATYEILEDDGSYFGRIPGFQGVWANEKTLEGCRDELESVLEDWLLVGISLHHELPMIDGVDLNVTLTNALAA
jgi:predicted RNase H-like HicB family nuclease